MIGISGILVFMIQGVSEKSQQVVEAIRRRCEPPIQLREVFAGSESVREQAGPITESIQRVCHDARLWLISFLLGHRTPSRLLELRATGKRGASQTVESEFQT